MNLAQIVQSHALSFFHLSAPDLLLGLDSDPARRNIFGLIAAEPRAGPRRHPPAPVRPGDHRAPGRQEDPSRLVGPRRRPRRPPRRRPRPHPRPPRRGLRRPSQIALAAVQVDLRSITTRRPISFGNFPLAVPGPGQPTTAPGSTTTASSASSTPTGQIVADQVDPARYAEFIGEAVEPDSYLKSPYYKPLGYPDGIYRVGPLARLNVCDAHGHAAGRPGARGVSRSLPRHGHLVVPLPLRPADRDPGRASS